METYLPYGRIRAKETGTYLSSNKETRHAIIKTILNRRHQVTATWSARCYRYSRLALDLRVTLRCEAAELLCHPTDVPRLVGAREGIHEMAVGAPVNQKDPIDAEIGQNIDDVVGDFHLCLSFARRSLSLTCRILSARILASDSSTAS